MKFIKYFLILIFALLLANVVYAETPREQLKQMVEQLQKTSNDNALREKIIRLAPALKPSPALPDAAITFEGRAQFAFRSAKSEGDYLAAAKEYEKAVAAAPWVPGYYADLCTIYEKANKFDDAKRHCEFYLISLTDSAEITNVKRRIAGFEFGIEKANSPETRATKKREQDELLIRTLDGAIYRFEMKDIGYWSTITINGKRVTVTPDINNSGPHGPDDSCVTDRLRCEWPFLHGEVRGTVIIEILPDGRRANKIFRHQNGEIDTRVYTRQ